MIKMIDELRKKLLTEEFDYQTLLDNLKEYRYPRNKISKLIKSKEIIRIKKGIYIFGEKYRKNRFSREVLANIIYGPSYISLEYALSYYGLIPERIETITSVTTKYNKQFTTPVGLFIYKSIPVALYSIGIDQIEISPNRFYLIAEPEKALVDFIKHEKKISIRSVKDADYYLFEYLRVDPEEFSNLDLNKLQLYAQKFKSNKLVFIIKKLIQVKKGSIHD